MTDAQVKAVLRDIITECENGPIEGLRQVVAKRARAALAAAQAEPLDETDKQFNAKLTDPKYAIGAAQAWRRRALEQQKRALKAEAALAAAQADMMPKAERDADVTRAYECGCRDGRAAAQAIESEVMQHNKSRSETFDHKTLPLSASEPAGAQAHNVRVLEKVVGRPPQSGDDDNPHNPNEPAGAPNEEDVVRTLGAALTAMTLASALPGVAREYDFSDAIETTRATYMALLRQREK